MAWTVRFSPGAKKSLRKLDKQIGKKILVFIDEKIIKSKDPREYGKSLKGELGEFWRYRVGDYRIICSIEDQSVEVLVLRIGHRKEVYKR